MTLTSSLDRLRHYYRTHGTQATLLRLKLALQRAAAMGQMVLFYCDLPITGALPSLENLDRKTNRGALTAAELERMVSHWNPEIMRRQINERFAANAELWLLRADGTIAAYGWTLKEKTMEPHFFPLKPGDIHLFDFFVFPEFRGRSLNPALVRQILAEVGREGTKRALIECAAWNKAQLSSLAKTPFRKLGTARKFGFGKSVRTCPGNSEK